MNRKYFSSIILCLIFFLFPVGLFAGDGDSESIGQKDKDEMMLARNENEEQLLYAYYGNDATIITSTRYLKPVSQVAENMSVVTAEMIKQMNAHTVAEVLNVVTGIQVDERFVFSNYSTAGIQGTGFAYVRILIDGVTLNNLTSNGYLLGNLPVQYIERIEIIKGPASSSWGSSLGGVINIVTKSGSPNNKVSGMLSSSYGARGSGDYRGEAGGSVSKLNYYVSGTYLGSDGFTPHSAFTNTTFYTKEKLDLTDKVNIVYTLGYTNLERGNGYYAILGNVYGNSRLHDLFTTLTLNASLTDQMSLSVGGRFINIFEDDVYYRKGITRDTLYQDQLDDENSKGATLTFTWRPEGHTITLGSDYDDGKATSLSIMGGDKTLTKTAFFVNDTISLIKDVYITPGLRFDDISANGNFLSPSLGIAYNPTEKITLRLNVARGFNTPSLAQTYATGLNYVPNPNLRVEKVWSYQFGVETTMLQFAWLKTTIFRHDVDDGLTAARSPGTLQYTYVNSQRQRRQGLEVELETFPIYHFSLNSGYSYVDTEDMLTGQRLSNIPRHTIDLGLRYKNNTHMAYIYGHYKEWDNMPLAYIVNDRAFVFNMNVSERLYKNNNISAEAFLTGHNLFNASQSYTGIDNPRRWFEAGLRLNF